MNRTLYGLILSHRILSRLVSYTMYNLFESVIANCVSLLRFNEHYVVCCYFVQYKYIEDHLIMLVLSYSIEFWVVSPPFWLLCRKKVGFFFLHFYGAFKTMELNAALLITPLSCV
jgi:hypothetical protein